MDFLATADANGVSRSPLVCPNLPDSIHSSIRPSIHPSFCSFFHPPTYPSIHPFIHSFFFFVFLRYLRICLMQAPTVNVREFMSSNSCKMAFANLAVHVPNADNLTWCGEKRSSNFFSFFLVFSFHFSFFKKKLEVAGVYRHEELSLTQQVVTNSKST